MAWITPRLDWKDIDAPTKNDFNRIEGNTEDLNTRTKNIVDGTTKVSKATHADSATKLHTARNINDVVFDGTKNITIEDDTKAPKSHASSGTSYGVGTTENYGHVKTINSLTQSSHVNGTALSAYQGKVLKDIKTEVVTGLYTGNDALSRNISLGFRPKAVFISGYGGNTMGLNRADVLIGGVALDGYPTKNSKGDTDGIIVISTGFTVINNSSKDIFSNALDKIYYYVAIK